MASRILWYLQTTFTIGDGPGVPETVKTRKKTLAEFSVFSIMQKRRREAILNDFGVHFEAYFWIIFSKKKCFFAGMFFFQLCDVFGAGPAAGGRPI